MERLEENPQVEYTKGSGTWVREKIQGKGRSPGSEGPKWGRGVAQRDLVGGEEGRESHWASSFGPWEYPKGPGGFFFPSGGKKRCVTTGGTALKEPLGLSCTIVA